MNKNSEANINDILARLRQNMEAQKSETVGENPTSSATDSPDEILDKLKEHVSGTETTTENFRENDYDISGFEITESVDDDIQPVSAEKEVNTEHEPIVAISEAEDEGSEIPEISDEHDEVATDDLPPWETEDPVVPSSVMDSDIIDEAETTPEETDPVQEFTSEKDAPVVLETQTALEDDFAENEEPQTVANEELEEAVRQRVELFVEKTVTPEEEFDYFAQMDRKAAQVRQEKERTEAANASDREISVEGIEDQAQQNDSIVQESDPLSADGDKTVDPQENGLVTEIPSAQSFFNPNKKASFSEGAAQADAIRFDDTDINLLLALGQKQPMEDAIGFVRVREAKNNFYDPADEEPIGRIFAYDGQEYRDQEQTEGIKTRYRKEKKKLYKRLVATFLLALILFFVEQVAYFHISIPYVSTFLESTVWFRLVGLFLLSLCLLVSWKTLLNGIIGFFTMRPNQHTPLSILASVVLLYNLASLLFFRNAEMMTFNFTLSVFLILSLFGDTIRLTKEMLTFDVISDKREKFSLEKAETSPEEIREEKALSKRDLLVERIRFVGKYFTRTSKRSANFTKYFVELLIASVIAIFAAIFSAVLEKSIANTVSAFVFTLFVCLPTQHMINVHALSRLSKILYRNSSAIIGETVAEEYVGANTVYLDDIEMFGHHGVAVSGLRIYNDADFYDVLYHAHAVFCRVEGPLRYVFENSAHEIEAAKDVQLQKLSANGIEALVDGCDKVFIGNINFMRSNGFFPKRNSEDDKKVENGELSILYMTVNGSLCSKFYMKYTITQRFEKFVAEMQENNTKVGIRTLDPNVTERMIALLRKDKDSVISVIRPTLNDLVPVGRRSDSGIITAKSPHMISKILAQCVRLKKVDRFSAGMRLLAMLVGLLSVAALVSTKAFSALPTSAIAVYQLLWLIPSFIYTKTNLK